MDPIPQPAANTVKTDDAFVNAMKAAVENTSFSEDEKKRNMMPLP